MLFNLLNLYLHLILTKWDAGLISFTVANIIHLDLTTKENKKKFIQMVYLELI